MIQGLTHKKAHDFTGELQEMLDFQEAQATKDVVLTKGQEICLQAVTIMATCQLAAIQLVTDTTPEQEELCSGDATAEAAAFVAAMDQECVDRLEAESRLRDQEPQDEGLDHTPSTPPDLRVL